ncbi:PIN-like domain-containing protein [Vreelandella alkaliphila]|uniref:PIN-like domain-containing protein n=1 Tax=Vreelandella alkaliphila TaxID=272774 RepID=UPI003FD726A1
MSFKNSFPEYFKEKEDLNYLWGECVFVFDANVIINLYRYSDDTKDSLLNVLEAYKDRVWISHQAAKEYLKNRTSVIAEEETNFVSAASKVETFVKDFQTFVGEQRKHPFVKDSLLEKLVDICNELKNELNGNGKKYFSRINDDEIRRKIELIFSDKIGPGFREEELEEIFIEGVDRYSNKTPPGYEDEEKGKKKIEYLVI